jgi:hypothetical protein
VDPNASSQRHLFREVHKKKKINFMIKGLLMMMYIRPMLITSNNGYPVLMDAADLSLIDGAKLTVNRDRKNNSYYAYARWLVDGGGTIQIGLGRVILGLKKADKLEAEHIDPDHTLDYRRSNLRIATRAQNNANRRMRKDNTSGFKGVTKFLNGSGWRAQIMVNGKARVLGVRETKEAAYELYCAAAREMHGEFARMECR